MRDYQIRGLNWMISLYENGINGILADEMVSPGEREPAFWVRGQSVSVLLKMFFNLLVLLLFLHTHVLMQTHTCVHTPHMYNN